MRIQVDEELCHGHATCELEAPDVFAVPKRGTVRVPDEDPPESLRDEVASAVRECPAQALRISG